MSGTCSIRYHPLFLFNDHGDCLVAQITICKIRPEKPPQAPPFSSSDRLNPKSTCYMFSTDAVPSRR